MRTRDARYMSRALRLAVKAKGMTSPNPLVGCVIVKNGRIVGEGYHKKAGLPHAEINALRRAGEAARGAEMYVTLEPCRHFGRTGPCADAVVRAGIRRVVAAMKDPNPVNNGKGLAALRRAGVMVRSGVMRAEAENINRPFIKYIKTGLPYITVKLAASLDGKIATRSGESRWISDGISRRAVQMLRANADAVMTGIGTLVKDDPLLLPKTKSRKTPARIIVDSKLRTGLKSRLVLSARRGRVYLATPAENGGRCGPYMKAGVNMIFTGSKAGRVDLGDLLTRIAALGMIDVLVEGGSELAGSLSDEKLADRFIFFLAPKVIGGRNAVPAVGGHGVSRLSDALELENMRVFISGKDVMIEAFVKRRKA